MPIAVGHLCSGQTQFSGNALWQQIAVFVADEGETVGDRTADGDVHIFVLVDDMIGRAYGELRRTIAVEQLGGCLLDRYEFLATEHDILDVQVVLVEQSHTQCGTHGHTRDLVVTDVGRHAVHVLMHGIAHHMDGSTGSQRIEQVER